MVLRSLSMSETALQPPDDVYGEYATANGFDESNDGTDTPFADAPPLDDPVVAAGDVAATDGVGS
jgi:hypothetical protein